MLLIENKVRVHKHEHTNDIGLYFNKSRKTKICVLLSETIKKRPH